MSKVPVSAISRVSSLESRLLMSRLVLGVLIGLCVGAVTGGLAFGTLVSDSTATAFVRLKVPVDLTAIAGGASQITPDNQDNTAKFVSGEIAYLSGDGFAQAVGRKMAQNEPAALNIAQASQSSIVTISCTSKSADVATRTVQTAIDLYSQDLARRVDERLRVLLPKLSEWQEREAAVGTPPQDLQRVRESVELQAAEASTLSVVQPPTPNEQSSHQWLIGMFLGALLGGSCAVAVILARRRRSGRGSLVKVLGEHIDGVVLPAVDLGAVQSDASTDEQDRLGRTLYNQCAVAGTNRAILVLGASPHSGGSAVASLLERAADVARPGANGSGQHWAPSSAESPTTTVIDGGTVGDRTVTPDVIAAATNIVLVAQLESDTIADASALVSATAASAVPVVAVFTYRRSRIRPFRKRRAGAEVAAVPPSASDPRGREE